jgi:mannose-1-phosphate guanylyltransferase
MQEGSVQEGLQTLGTVAAKDEPKRIGIVMAGGSGERFWPLSSGKTPKQLLKLTHPTKNMLEEAVERLDGVVGQVFVSTSTMLGPIIAESGFVPADAVLAEPAKRNTLGALVWVAAELIARGHKDASVAVVTADHFIGEVERFRSAVTHALELAESSGTFVTFGITPTRPETGYGYIEVAEIPEHLEHGWRSYRSAAFREKPDQQTALDYVASRRYLWNSGMFFFTVEGFVRELALVQPEAAQALEGIVDALRRGDEDAALAQFETVPNLSIDYGVMEKVPHVYTVPVNFPWDDVGAWDALERTGDPSDEGNSIRGNPVLIEVTNSVIVQTETGINVGVLGVDDLIVVSTGSAVLVCHKSKAQRVRELARLVQAQT